MKLNTLFMINAVVAFLFSLGFLLIPATIVSFYGVQLDTSGLYFARLLGAAFFSFGVISWLVRNAAGSGEVRAILLAFLIGDLIGFVISLAYQMQGVANALGWSTVAIYLLLGLGFGYFYWKK